MRLSTFFLGKSRRIVTNALVTAIISVPTASCLKTEKKQNFASSGNGSTTQDKASDAGDTIPTPDKKTDDKKPAAVTKAQPVSVTWDGNAPRGTSKYAVVATE